MAKERRFTVTLPGDLHQQLKILCAVNNLRMGDVVRDLVQQQCAGSTYPTKLDKGRGKAKQHKAGAEAA